MKGLKYLVLALAVFAFCFDGNARRKNRKSKKAQVVRLDTCAVDTFSYAMGMANTQGLKNFLVSRMNVDTAYMADFLKGFNTTLTPEERKTAEAYAAGLQIRKQVEEQVIPGLDKRIAGNDTTQLLDRELFIQAFGSTLAGEATAMTLKQADSIAEKKMTSRFEKCCNDYRDAVNKVAIRQSSAHPMSEFLGTLLIVAVLWFGGSLILSNNAPIDASTFIFYMVILYSIINPLKEFSKASYNIPRGLASMERIDKILKAENPIKEAEHPKTLSDLNEKIEFKDISFSYDGKKEVLKHINIVIPKGKTIALVGQSGSGKSTLVDLLPRYHDVQEGEITIDGTNIKDLRIHDLRSLIGNVNQEAILFNDTFFNNIAFGVENATMEQVIAAAKIANAHDFIMEKPEGYNTNIGDRGSKLSGGQRQRISIARAILKNPPILILDEATSALDTESERLVQEALERLMKTRTTIAIAHRLSTIKNADEIYVLYNGQIVERGTHDELIKKQGYYKRLHDMQSLG